MKKKNIKYSKENFKKLLRYIDNHRKQFVGSVATVGLTGFITLTSFLATACTQEEIDAANELISQLSTEQTVDNPEPEITVEPEVVEPETVIEPEVVEPVEEVNPRDMKAVYGLDYDVPIYTEEEIEQAKSNLTSNYDDNIVESVDIVAERGYTYTDEQLKEMAPDYYAANQDLWYQLNDMVKDYHGAPAGTYYDEENDLYITVDSKGTMNICGKNFEFKKRNNNDIKVPIGEIAYSNLIQVGPGTYAILGSNVTRQWAYEGSAGMYENYDGRSFETLENAGYNPQKIEHDCINIEDEAYSLELK